MDDIGESKQAWLVGIDGGGTRTRAQLATADGDVLGVGSAASGNIHDVGEETVGRHVHEAVAEAWRAAGLAARPADSVFMGMGSVVTDEDRRVVARIGRNMVGDAGVVGVDHDLRIACAGALGEQAGVVLIAGTGASCLGQSAAGEAVMVGGWGRVIDDAGSGYDLGLQAMRAVVRAEDGRGEATSLLEAVKDAYGVTELRALMRIVEEPCARRRIAGLGPVVLHCAQGGDGVALDIVKQGVEELALLVERAVEGTFALEGESVVGPDLASEKKQESEASARTLPVAVVGGLFDSGPWFADLLWQAIGRQCAAAQRALPKASPLEGAVLLARRQWQEAQQ